jgi:hypothetical protein
MVNSRDHNFSPKSKQRLIHVRLSRYDPENVYTEDGALVIELTKEPDETSHGLGCKPPFS